MPSWSGTTARAGAHIERILSNDRFVLVPGVQVPNLASHVLGKTIKRLAQDWEQEHGVRPWLVETCVQSSRPGTSYKAAGWQCVGPTQGRPPGAGEAVETKAVWLLGLDANWQQKLGRKPEQKLGQYPELVLNEEANWARREYLAFGPAGRAAAAAAGADGAELGAASGGGSAGNLPAPGGPAGRRRAFCTMTRCRIGISCSRTGRRCWSGCRWSRQCCWYRTRRR